MLARIKRLLPAAFLKDEGGGGGGGGGGAADKQALQEARREIDQQNKMLLLRDQQIKAHLEQLQKQQHLIAANKQELQSLEVCY